MFLPSCNASRFALGVGAMFLCFPVASASVLQRLALCAWRWGYASCVFLLLQLPSCNASHFVLGVGAMRPIA